MKAFIPFIFLISSLNLFSQEDIEIIKTYNSDSSQIVYKYLKKDSCICSSTIDTVLNKEIFFIVDEKPFFGEGSSGEQSIINIISYLKQNLHYPSIADYDMSGRVFVKFTIGMDGSLSNIHVIRGLDVWADEEAIRVIKNMPNWRPGKCNGKEVPVYYALPVSFLTNE